MDAHSIIGYKGSLSTKDEGAGICMQGIIRYDADFATVRYDDIVTV